MNTVGLTSRCVSIVNSTINTSIMNAEKVLRMSFVKRTEPISVITLGSIKKASQATMGRLLKWQLKCYLRKDRDQGIIRLFPTFSLERKDRELTSLSFLSETLYFLAKSHKVSPFLTTCTDPFLLGSFLLGSFSF